MFDLNELKQDKKAILLLSNMEYNNTNDEFVSRNQIYTSNKASYPILCCGCYENDLESTPTLLQSSNLPCNTIAFFFRRKYYKKKSERGFLLF